MGKVPMQNLHYEPNTRKLKKLKYILTPITQLERTLHQTSNDLISFIGHLSFFSIKHDDLSQIRDSIIVKENSHKELTSTKHVASFVIGILFLLL